MILAISAVLLLASQGLAQRDAVCLEDNGFFEDPEQCDAYYRCVDGKATWELCPDGLAFLFYPYYQGHGPRCDFLIGVNCGERTKLQPAQPVGECDRKYGIFPHKSDCNRFWQCDNGEAYEMQCPYTLAYNEEFATCDYYENVARCQAPETPVSCPQLNELERLFNPHPLLPDPDNCAQFFICLSGKYPRTQGCPPGTLYNAQGRVCEPEELVDCAGRPVPPKEEEETNFNRFGGRDTSRARSRSSGRSLETNKNEEAFVDPQQDLEKVSYTEEVDQREGQATQDNSGTYENPRTYENTRSFDEATYEEPAATEEPATELPATEYPEEPVVEKKTAKKRLTVVGKKEDRAERREKDETRKEDDSALISFNFGRTSQDGRQDEGLTASADLSASSY